MHNVLLLEWHHVPAELTIRIEVMSSGSSSSTQHWSDKAVVSSDNSHKPQMYTLHAVICWIPSGTVPCLIPEKCLMLYGQPELLLHKRHVSRKPSVKSNTCGSDVGHGLSELLEDKFGMTTFHDICLLQYGSQVSQPMCDSAYVLYKRMLWQLSL